MLLLTDGEVAIIGRNGEDDGFEVKRAGLTPWLVGSTEIRGCEGVRKTSSEDEGVCSGKPRRGRKTSANFLSGHQDSDPTGPDARDSFRAVTTIDSEAERLKPEHTRHR